MSGSHLAVLWLLSCDSLHRGSWPLQLRLGFRTLDCQSSWWSSRCRSQRLICQLWHQSSLQCSCRCHCGLPLASLRYDAGFNLYIFWITTKNLHRPATRDLSLSADIVDSVCTWHFDVIFVGGQCRAMCHVPTLSADNRHCRPTLLVAKMALRDLKIII